MNTIEWQHQLKMTTCLRFMLFRGEGFPCLLPIMHTARYCEEHVRRSSSRLRVLVSTLHQDYKERLGLWNGRQIGGTREQGGRVGILLWSPLLQLQLLQR
jgi:hypothetical protein